VQPTRARELTRPFTSLTNFRDIGGQQTSDGHVVKTGVLFRSEDLSRIKTRDLEQLRQLNLRLICDLRSPAECRRRPSRVAADSSLRIVNIPLHDEAKLKGNGKLLLRCLLSKNGDAHFRAFCRGYYHHLAFERTALVGQVVSLLAREESLPALIHCTAGRDRTGFIAALIQLLLGVPYQTVLDEYLCTNDRYAPRLEKLLKLVRILTLFQVPSERVRLLLMAHPDSLAEVHDSIVREHGSIEGYLSDACSLDGQALKTLRQSLLVRHQTGHTAT
jgi:protein-tyrosine phosphatase